MKTALLVIDFINDIVSPQGKIPTCAAQVAERHVVDKANRAIQVAREQHWLILFVKVGFSSHYYELPTHSPVFSKARDYQALALGQYGTEFVEGLAISSQDAVVVKHRISPFYATDLDLILRNNGIQRLMVCGVSSAWAIQAAVRDGHDRDYEMVIVEDACAAATYEEHSIAMQQLSRIAKIITTTELIV